MIPLLIFLGLIGVSEVEHAIKKDDTLVICPGDTVTITPDTKNVIIGGPTCNRFDDTPYALDGRRGPIIAK